MPVSNEDLAPAWTPKLIGKDFKPKRIIFGSTGQFGDNRTLPLRFDFGSSDYGAYMPMESAGKLKMADKRRNRTKRHLFMDGDSSRGLSLLSGCLQ